MTLTDAEHAHAVRVLAAAGIHGSDAATCLRTMAAMTPTTTWADCLRSLRGRTTRELFQQYGTDAGRAAVVLGSA